MDVVAGQRLVQVGDVGQAQVVGQLLVLGDAALRVALLARHRDELAVGVRRERVGVALLVCALRAR